VGNASGAAMHAVSGTSGAAPVWRALVQQLHADRPSRPPPPPPGVSTLAIRFEGAQEPPRDERFLAGTGQALQRASSQAGLARSAAPAYGITSPREGSVFALDPDIPPAAQRITFEGEAGHWWLDGRSIGRGTRLRWAPWPGLHRLELRGANGQALQVVRFEVRGASLKAGALPAVAHPAAAHLAVAQQAIAPQAVAPRVPGAPGF
jgi:penicillin-binding protein 1C